MPTEQRGEHTGVPLDDIVIEAIELTEISTGPMLTTHAEQQLERRVFEFQNLLRDLFVRVRGAALFPGGAL